MATYGGDTPLLKWETINVEAPTGTSPTQKVVAGDILALKGGADEDGSGFKAVVATAGETFANTLLGIALYDHETLKAPMALHRLAVGSAQVRSVRYTGSPVLGQGVQISASNVRRVVNSGAAAGGGPMIVRIIDDEWLELLF